MPTHAKPAYVPFFESTLSALANLSPEDVCSYVNAVRAYVYEGVEPECMGERPNCTAVAKAVFEMGRYQLDETLRRSATNRSNAQARRKRKASGNVATQERDDSETVSTGERESSETEANGERSESETEANGERNGIYSNNQLSISNISSSSSKGAGVEFEIPDKGAWIAYFNAKCRERGVPPDSEQAAQAWGYYEDHGWAHKDGTGFRNWHRQCSTCVTRYAKDVERRGKGAVGNGRRGNGQGGFSGAARDFDAGAISVESIV